MKVDIGGGMLLAPGYVNLDPIHGTGEFKRRIQDGIPLLPNSVEAVRASHLVEHIPYTDRIPMMNEVHRVLVPGGRFEIITPMFPSWQAIADPTHVSFWVQESFFYFTGQITPQANYGIFYWQWGPLGYYVEDGWEIHADLMKPA
jgi:SAM-dependent methyltransferase